MQISRFADWEVAACILTILCVSQRQCGRAEVLAAMGLLQFLVSQSSEERRRNTVRQHQSVIGMAGVLLPLLVNGWS